MVDATHVRCRESVHLAGGLAAGSVTNGWLREGEEAHEGGEFEAKFAPQAVVRLTDVLLASHENRANVDARPATQPTLRAMNKCLAEARTHSASAKRPVDGTGV